MPTIDILGWFDRSNLGDEAYKIAYASLLPAATLRFHGDPDRFRTDGSPIILGGGDVVYPAFTRQLPAQDCAAVSVSLTTESDFAWLRGCRRVLVRDHRSLALARQHDVIHAEYGPDLAFRLQPDAVRGRHQIERLFAQSGQDLYRRCLVIVYSAYLLYCQPESYTRDTLLALDVLRKLAGILDRTAASVLFVPFSTAMPHDDRIANGLLASHCKWWKKNLVLHQPVDVQTALDLIAGADACLSSRLHATIFATLAATPVVDLTHHDKNRGFLETLRNPDRSVSFWDLGVQDCEDRLQAALAHGNRDPGLQADTRHAQDQLRHVRLL